MWFENNEYIQIKYTGSNDTSQRFQTRVALLECIGIYMLLPQGIISKSISYWVWKFWYVCLNARVILLYGYSFRKSINNSLSSALPFSTSWEMRQESRQSMRSKYELYHWYTLWENPLESYGQKNCQQLSPELESFTYLVTAFIPTLRAEPLSLGIEEKSSMSEFCRQMRMGEG